MFRYLSIIICSTLLFWSCQSKHKHTQQCSCGEDHSEFFKEKEAPKPDKQGYIVKIGDDAPNFKIPLASGAVFELAQQKGKVVMLQFTASWCGVCRKEMPFIEKEIYQVHKDNKEFVLMGIDVDESFEKMAYFAKKTGITYPLGRDQGSLTFYKYADRNAGVTRNVIINREGKIIYMTRLFNKTEFNKMKEVIENELNKD